MSEVNECQGKCACGDTCRRVDGHLEHECPKCNYLREMRDDEPLRSGGITATPALDRASIPAMFNVVGDELRKLNERLERIEGELMVKDGLFSYRQSMNVKVTAILAQLNKFQQDNEELAEEGRGIVKERGERLTRIESQLTALRAEADKGRVALSVQFEARMTDLDNMLSAQWLQAKILHEFTNKRLKAMESAPRKKKQERKKGRK